MKGGVSVVIVACVVGVCLVVRSSSVCYCHTSGFVELQTTQKDHTFYDFIYLLWPVCFNPVEQVGRNILLEDT